MILSMTMTIDAIHCEKVTYITALLYFKHCTHIDGTATLCK